MEVVSSEIEATEIHMKSEDTEGKDQIVEPEKESATIVSEKDYICDDIPNEEVNDEQGSVDTSGEVKEEVLEEVVHVKEIHEERASIPETEDLTTIVEKKDATVESEGTEKLELSSAAGLKEVRLEKEELQKPNDFEVEEKKPEHEDEALASHVQECNTYETEFILNENAAQELSLTLIQDEEHAESRAVEKVREDTESTKEPREIAIADDPSIDEGHASVQDAEQFSVEVNDANAEVVLEEHALIENVNPTGNGDKEIADRKAEELNSKEDFKVAKEEVEKPEIVVTEISSVTMEREVKVESEVNEEVFLQPKETEDKSIDAIVIMEDEEKEQGHPLIQQAEGLTVSVEDAKPEESKDDEEIETVEDKETICKDVLEAEESTEVVLAEYASMEKENDVNQIGDGDMEPTAALDVSGGDQGGFLEDIQKEELSSSAELQKSNGYQVEETSTAYTEQTEVNSYVEIAETSVPSDAAEVSTPLVPLQFVESSSSMVVSESETREAVEEELESNSYLNEVKETPTIGDATDETMLDGSEACEVPESGVKAKEYLDEASYIQVEVKGKAQDGNEEAKSSETTEVVSSEIELPEIHIKSEDAEGKDKTVEPEEQPATIDAAKDYIRDDISNEEVSVDTSGEVKEQVTEESASIPETEDLTTIVEKKDATVESEETENLELSSAVVLKEVCLEKEELQKPIDFEVEEKKPEHEDEALASHVQECNTYENELILNENATQERQSASEQAQGDEIQYVCIVNENAEEETEDKSKLSVVNEEETPMVRQDDILQTKEMDDKSMNAADVICEDGGEEQLSLALIQDEEHTESQAVEMEAEVASFELLEKVREDTEAIKEPREIAIIEEGHSSIQEAEQLSVEVNDANAEKDSIVEENAEEENQNKFKLSAVNEEVLQPKETEDNSIDAIVIMEDEENEQGHPSIQHPEENETVEDKETTCKDVLEAEESTEVALAEYASMEKENDVNQIGDGDKEATAYVVVAESETREAVEEEVESNSYLNEAKETPTIGDAADETTSGYEVPESGVEAKECLEEASIIQVDENEEVHSGNQEKEIETMEVVSSEIEATEIHMKSEDTEGKDTIVEPEKESATIVSEKDYICDDIPNEEVNDEHGSAESIIESTSIAKSIIEKDVIVESEETEKETEENNTMEIERSKMLMQDSSSIPPQTEEVIMEENASYNKIGNEESVEVLREQTTTEEPPLSESVQESEAVSKETLILDTQHEFEELEKQPKSTDDSVYDLISNEGVNDEQQASVETTEEIEDQVVEKQNMSDEIELGDAEEIQQTPDEHVAERSCEIEMQVIKEDISIEDVYTLGKDGERDIDESDSKLEDGAEKSVNEVNKGSDSELVPDQYIEATGESESSAVKQQETVEKTEVENELIKIESSNIEEISVADVKEETPIEEEADSEEQGERGSGSWEDTSENESSTGKLEEKVVTEVEEISCPAEKVELANEAQPDTDTESKETEVSSHVTFETIKEETETKESISEAEVYENGDLKIQDDAEKQHESVNEKIEPLQDGISHAEADNGYEAVESETNEVSFVIEASEQEISSVEEKGTVSGDYIETEDITECIREGDDETQEPATKSESSTAALHKEEDMSSILQDKAAEEHAKEETAEEIESPGFASSVTLETGALTSEVNHEFVDSEAKNLNLEEIKFLDVTEEKKDTVSGECKEAGDTSTCVTEAEIDSTVTIESTEVTSEETEAKKEEADSEPENCGLVEAEGPVSGEYKEAEEDSSKTAGEVAEASEATEGVKFTEEEEKGENEATKQFIGEDVDAAKENYETVTEVSKVLTPTVHSEDIESSKEVAEEEDTSYVKSVAVDEVDAKLSDVVTENGSELHPPREEAEGDGGLQDCASKEAVISDGGTQIVFDDGKITPEVKAEAFTTGVVEKNIDTSYVVIDAEVRDSKSQIIDGKGFDETSLDAATDKAADLSLSDLLHEARDQNLEVPMPLTEEKDMVGSTSELHNEETDAHEAKTDEEAEEVMVESCKEIDVKTPKKHSNILSGVSSKVKHSISKVKKAITGKSSNSKTKVSKTNEALPDS